VNTITGPVFKPGDDGYDDERAGLNTALDHRPAYVVGATGPADVVAAVSRASAEGRPVAVLATGCGPRTTRTTSTGSPR
jgi:hypothetical protein